MEQYNKTDRRKNKQSNPSYYELLKNILDDCDASDHFEEDEFSLAKTLIDFKPQFYSNARIYGLKFQSRGSKLREYALGDGGMSWKEKANYSSWCKFPHRRTFRYAKINTFFEVNIGDISVDGLLIASVTSHEHTRRPPNLVDMVNHNNSMDRSILFIALQEIYPTRIALFPFDENHLPIKISRNTKKQIEETKFVNLRTNTQLNYYYMCQMDSDKLSRMPEKRPFTMYLSSSSKRENMTSATQSKIPSNCTTKLSYRSLKANGQILHVRKDTNNVDKEVGYELIPPVSVEMVSNKPVQIEQTILSSSVINNASKWSINRRIEIKSKDSYSSISEIESSKNILSNAVNSVVENVTNNRTFKSKLKQTIFPSNTSKLSNRIIEIKPKRVCSIQSAEKTSRIRYHDASVSVGEYVAAVAEEAVNHNFHDLYSSSSEKGSGIAAVAEEAFNADFHDLFSSNSEKVSTMAAVAEEDLNAVLLNFNSRSRKQLSKMAADKHNAKHEDIVDLCDICSDNGSSIAVFPAAAFPGCCKICGKSPIKCVPYFMGVDQTSSDNVRYSFPWRGNSCALDSVGSCLQMIFDNLTSKGKDIMEEYCPDLCDVFRNLSNGTFTTFEAKSILESLLVERLQTDHQNTFQKIRKHQFHSIELAYQLFLIRPPSLAAVTIQADTNVPSTFTSTFWVKPLCRNKCNAGLKQEFLDDFSTCIRANIVSSQTFSDLCIKSSRKSSSDKCQECGNFCCKAEYSQVQGALLIRILDHQTFDTASTLSKPVPDQIQLGLTSYTLFACIYGNRMHFVSMVRDSSKNRILFHDGMANNAQFVERALDNTFPGELSDNMNLDSAFYVRSDYVTY